MLKVISLFFGAGGLDFGFHKNPKFEIILANDFNKHAEETYKYNYPNSPFVGGDIKQIIPNLPQCDIVIGGFPCPSFSLSGLRKGFEDPRGLEFFSCVKSIKVATPKIFIFENVKGILSHNKGSTLKTVLNELSHGNYNVEYKLLKMKNFGVPQNRERVFFIGVRKDISIDPLSLYPQETNEFIDFKKFWVSLGSIPPEDKETNRNMHLPKKKKHWILLLKEGENLKDLDLSDINKRENALGLNISKCKPKTYQGYRRLDSKTIPPTMMFGNTCLPIHPTQNRSISVRDAATIQTFPQDFIFKGPISSQYKQVGNAVPPKFSFILANHLAQTLGDTLEKI